MEEKVHIVEVHLLNDSEYWGEAVCPICGKKFSISAHSAVGEAVRFNKYYDNPYWLCAAHSKHSTSLADMDKHVAVRIVIASPLSNLAKRFK